MEKYITEIQLETVPGCPIIVHKILRTRSCDSDIICNLKFRWEDETQQQPDLCYVRLVTRKGTTILMENIELGAVNEVRIRENKQGPRGVVPGKSSNHARGSEMCDRTQHMLSAKKDALISGVEKERGAEVKDIIAEWFDYLHAETQPHKKPRIAVV